MKISHIASLSSNIARGPFRALTTVVEFFAPWQREARLSSGPASSPVDMGHSALSVAHMMRRRQAWAEQPVTRPAQLVVSRGFQTRHAGGVPAHLRNTAILAANQPSLAPRDAAAATRPLRVFRAPEAQMPASASGRMVISGRMADVCAELERLSAAAQMQQA